MENTRIEILREKLLNNVKDKCNVNYYDAQQGAMTPQEIKKAQAYDQLYVDTVMRIYYQFNDVTWDGLNEKYNAILEEMNKIKNELSQITDETLKSEPLDQYNQLYKKKERLESELENFSKYYIDNEWRNKFIHYDAKLLNQAPEVFRKVLALHPEINSDKEEKWKGLTHNVRALMDISNFNNTCLDSSQELEFESYYENKMETSQKKLEFLKNAQKTVGINLLESFIDFEKKLAEDILGKDSIGEYNNIRDNIKKKNSGLFAKLKTKETNKYKYDLGQKESEFMSKIEQWRQEGFEKWLGEDISSLGAIPSKINEVELEISEDNKIVYLIKQIESLMGQKGMLDKISLIIILSVAKIGIYEVNLEPQSLKVLLDVLPIYNEMEQAYKASKTEKIQETSHRTL